MEDYLAYCSCARDDFSSIGESIEIAPQLRIVKTELSVSDVARACKELAHGGTPVFVCRIGPHDFSVYTPTVDEDSRIRAFLGIRA